MKSPKEIVKHGYDKVSYAYRGDDLDQFAESYLQYKTWIDEFGENLDDGSSVLDLGCGCGLPTTRLLSRRHKVIGVDISPVQIKRAKELVPEADFLCGDMCEMDFASGQFDAITCLYAIIHVPLAEQPDLICRIARWLRPSGSILLTCGYSQWTGQEVNWLGVEGGDMYWSHADRDTYLKWLRGADLVPVWDRFIPEGNGGHTLILAKKNGEEC